MVDRTLLTTPTQSVSSLRQYRIARIARLPEQNTDILTEDGRLAVEEVAHELDRDGDLRELLEDRARRDARVRAQNTEGDLVVVEVDAPTHGVDDGVGLLR